MSALLPWLHHPIALTLGRVLLHFLWQGTLLAIAAALLLWLLKGSSPRLRYAVACGVMLVMIALPPITFHQLWIRPTSIEITKHPEAVPLVSSESAPMQIPAFNWRVQVQQALEKALPYALLGWLSGILVLSSRLTGGWAWLQWLRRRRDTVPTSDDQQLLLLRLCQRMKLVSNIRLLRCDHVEGPTVLGWLKPVVLIPGAALTGLSPAHLELVLAHELAHILRHDYAVNLFQSVIEVLLFYHPAVWWLSARIRQERELCCDDLAVRHSGDALDYAQALTHLETLRLARDRSSPSSQPVLSMSAHGGSFMHRIQRLVSPTVPTPLAPRAGMIALLLTGGTLALQARMTPPDPPTVQAEAPLPQGAIRLRRYDIDSADGKHKAGTIDMITKASDVVPMEQALAKLEQMPKDPVLGYVELSVDSTIGEYFFNYHFQDADPAKVKAMIKAWASYHAIQEKDKQPGNLVIQRRNICTEQLGLVPRGLNVYVSAVDIPADQVLQALMDLEAMTPAPGIPQEIRRRAVPNTSDAERITLDLQNVDPLELRDLLEPHLKKH